MSHEHNGHCCAPHEQPAAANLAELTAGLGQLCCSGQCQHIEHQAIGLGHELQHQLLADEELDEFGVKKKKKKKQLGQLGIYLADSQAAPLAAA